MRCIYSDIASSNRSSPALRLVAQIHCKSSILQTREWVWVRVRYDALRTNDDRWFALCGHGKYDSTGWNVDHIKPRHTLPHMALAIRNLQILCSDGTAKLAAGWVA